MDLRDIKRDILAKAKCLYGNFYPPTKAGGNSTGVKSIIGKAHSNSTEAKYMNRNAALGHSYKTKAPIGFSQNNLLNLPIIIGIKTAAK
jgi:hypothetical protein